jgi:hypothetical protein
MMDVQRAEANVAEAQRQSNAAEERYQSSMGKVQPCSSRCMPHVFALTN